MSDEMRGIAVCERARNMLDDYMDGALGDDQALFLRTHAANCPDCAKKLRATELLARDLRGLDDYVGVPLNAQSAWRRAVRHEIARAKRRRFARAFAGIAAAFLVMIGSTLALRGGLLHIEPDNAGNASAPTYALANAEQPRIFAPTRVNSREMAAAAGKARMLVQSDGDFGNESTPDTAQSASAQTTDSVFTGEYDAPAQMVRRAARVAQTDMFDQEKETLNELVIEYDGYFASDNIDFSLPERVLTCVIRVPDEQLDTFLAALENIGNTISIERTSEDVSAYHYDAQSRLDAQKLIADRLVALIPQADGEALIALNAQLSDAYDQIDEMQRIINAYANDVEYAAVSFTLREISQVPAPTAQPSLSERSASGFSQSIAAIGDFFEDMVVSMAIIAPVAGAIIVLAAAVFAIAYLVKRKNRKNEESKEK